MAQHKDDSKDKGSSWSDSPWKAVGVATGAGFTMLSCLAVGAYLGHLVDGLVGTSFPLCLVIGGVFGAFIGMYSIYLQLTRS